MSVIVAQFQAKPGLADSLEQVLKALIPDVEKEAGTLQYVLHRVKNEEGSFLFYERYASEDAVKSHLASPYLKKALELSRDLIVGQPSVIFCDEIAAIKR
jgi:quinol monooxygenase YgiN